MTKQELLRVMRVLSALEAIGLILDSRMPDTVLEEIDMCVQILEREILK